jgi:DNA-binding transcriptional LysR family regulator
MARRPAGRAAGRTIAAERGETSTVAFEPLLATGSFDSLIEAAIKGAGIASLPAANCREALASGALVCVPPQLSGIEGILHLVFASRRGMLPSVRTVIDFAAAALQASAAPSRTEGRPPFTKWNALSSN